MTSRALLTSSLASAAFALSLAAAPAADAAGFSVPLDEVKVITFKTPVKTVFVGNPTIADVTVIDPQHVFVLGKSFGTTNLVALDDRGRETVNSQISVFDRPGSVVTLHRGPAKITLSCTTVRCEAAPTPGDDKEPFEQVTTQIDRRQSLSLKAAGQ